MRTRFFGSMVGRLMLFALASAGVALGQTAVPIIAQPLVPDSAAPAGAGFILTVNGTGFASGSIVTWNGSALATTFVSQSQLKAAVLSSDIAKPGVASVSVVNPSRSSRSNVVFFEVTPASVTMEFAAAINPATYPGIYPSPVIAGDFNGDGKLDLTVGNLVSNNISILLGNGDATFQTPVDYGRGSGPWELAVGDFNGDGKLISSQRIHPATLSACCWEMAMGPFNRR
jgi:hypothetical protein